MLNKTKRFFEPILQIPLFWIKTIIIQVFYSWITIFNIFYIKHIIYLLESWNSNWLQKAIIIYIIVSILYLITIYFARHWWYAWTYFPHVQMIHRKYMPIFNNLDNTYIENIWTWKAISIISKWINTWSTMIIDVLQTPIKLIISLVSAFIIMSEIWFLYILLFIIIFIISHLLVFKLNNIAIKWRNLRRDTMIEYDRQIIKMIMSKFEILQNNKIQKEIQVLDKYSQKANNYNLKVNYPLFIMFTIPNFIFFIITIFIFLWLQNWVLSFSVLISIFLILSLLKENMQWFIVFFKNFTNSYSDIEKLWSFFDDWGKITWLNNWKDFEYKSWNIEIKDLNFSYYEWKNIFSNFNLNLTWWEITAFVWVSWSWKTTLVKLISWFLKQNSWEILIDWQNIKNIKLKSYFKYIWYLTQEPSIFDWTILENLVYWVEDDTINDKIIFQAISDAKCEFIYDFENWVDTQIWEKWVRLSWWQRQRLAIAKLFIKNPDIIILDEPTSALDSFSEECIKQSFEKLFKNKTVIIIAHRLQTVKNAKNIIVFDWGKILERWNHEWLLKQNWYYKKMLDLQSGF